MREGKINLDWLDGEIARIEKSLSSPTSSSEAIASLKAMLFEAKVIRGNCTPIEESERVILPKTCVNQWESNQYCDKKDACEMCKLK